MIETYKNKYLSGISMFLHKTFRTGLVSLSRSKWLLLWSKLIKVSRILTLLHKTFRTGLVFWVGWAQIVVCYDRKLQKHKYLSGISTFLHKTFRTGLVFCTKPSEQRNINISAQNLQNNACFSEMVEISQNSGMLELKSTKT